MVLPEGTGSRSVGPSALQIRFHCGGECVENQAVGVLLISLGLIESIFFFVYNNHLFHVPSFVI